MRVRVHTGTDGFGAPCPGLVFDSVHHARIVVLHSCHLCKPGFAAKLKRVRVIPRILRVAHLVPFGPSKIEFAAQSSQTMHDQSQCSASLESMHAYNVAVVRVKKARALLTAIVIVRLRSPPVERIVILVDLSSWVKAQPPV